MHVEIILNSFASMQNFEPFVVRQLISISILDCYPQLVQIKIQIFTQLEIILIIWATVFQRELGVVTVFVLFF